MLVTVARVTFYGHKSFLDVIRPDHTGARWNSESHAALFAPAVGAAIAASLRISAPGFQYITDVSRPAGATA